MSISTPTHAAEPGAKVEISAVRYDATAINAATQQASVATLSTTIRQRVDAYLLNQSRLGRFIDEASVNIARLPNPAEPNSTIDLIWSGAKSPSSVAVVAKTGDGVRAAGLGIGYSPAEPTKAPPSSVEHSSGYGVGIPGSGMTIIDPGWCPQTYFGNYGRVTSCYRSFKANGQARWIYSRWGMWELAQPAGLPLDDSHWTTDYYMASRPWNGPNGNYVTSMSDWQPRNLDGPCWTLGNVNIGQGAFSLNFPVTHCYDYNVDFSTPHKRFGVDLYDDGDWWQKTRTDRLTMEIAAEFTTSSATATNVWWADYNWVSVKYCDDWFGLGPCSGPNNFVAKDSGW